MEPVGSSVRKFENGGLEVAWLTRSDVTVAGASCSTISNTSRLPARSNFPVRHANQRAQRLNLVLSSFLIPAGADLRDRARAGRACGHSRVDGPAKRIVYRDNIYVH